MNPEHAKISLAVVEDLKNKGYSQSEISRMTGYTRQYISWIVHTYGGRLTPRQKLLKEHFPWKVPAEQCQSAPYRRMRDHGEYAATWGEGMSQDKLKRLSAFHQKFRHGGLVLEFDPDLPPELGVANKGGFAFQKRTPEDEDLLMRVNGYTHLTEQGRLIWRLPSVDQILG